MGRKGVIRVAERKIGKEHPPFVIAEMSGNHNGSLDRALEIVKAAAKAGAHAIKLQTYTADTMTLDIAEREFVVNDEKSLWRGFSLYELYQKAYTPWEWHQPIFEFGRELGLIVFSTPFDHSAVDFLEGLGCPAYKVASFENIDLPLLRRIAQTGKPVMMSTGMATLAELDESIRTLKGAGCQELILLKCTSTYPASPADSNLQAIPHLQEMFDLQVGVSDHTLGIGVCVAGVAFGATVIEKHFTLNRGAGGVDAAFSLEPQEMKNLVLETERAWQGMGQVHYGLTEKEKASLTFRRSLYVAQDMKAGDIFTPENLRSIRPGFGLPPKYYDVFLGKRVSVDVKKGTPLSWDLLGNDFLSKEQQ